MKQESVKNFRLDEQGVLWFDNHLVVPKDRELKNQLMDEAHLFKLSVHPGSNKMYHDWKWDDISMDFVTDSLPPKGDMIQSG
jgi:hypothetical protein